MELRHKSLLGLILVSFMPTISILFTYSISGSESQSQMFFLFAKIWIRVPYLVLILQESFLEVTNPFVSII